MRKIFLLILAIILVGCSAVSNTSSTKLSIVGDIADEIVLSIDNIQTMKIDDGNYPAISLLEIFENNGLDQQDYRVMFIANDSLTNVIEDAYDEVFLVEKNNQWHVHSDTFPPTLQLKDLNRLIFMKKQVTAEDGLTLLTTNEDRLFVSAGNFLSYNPETLLLLDGISNKGYNQMQAYQQKQVLALDKISDAKRFLILSNNGDHYYSNENHFLVCNKTSIDLMDDANKVLVSDVNGIIENPPSSSIMDVFYDVEYYLQDNQKVMVILVDGFGYHQFEHAKKNNIAPFLTSFTPKIASSVFTPVTNAGMAAILTGQPPRVNGILNRDYREVFGESIFDVADSLNKRAMLLEGNINILNINAEVKLHLDNNNSGSSDDEIFESALDLSKDLELMMIHFHGFDDAGHNYGALDPRTMETLDVLDQYIGELVEAWDGVTLLVSDHGMHTSEDGGSHGIVTYQDMFVPYIIIP